MIQARRPVPSVLLVATAVVLCGVVPGGRASAASASPGTPQPIAISPVIIGSAQLAATFSTDDRYFAGDVITLDGGPVTASADAGGFLTFTAAPSCGKHTLDDKYLINGELDQEFAGSFIVSCITATPGAIIGTQEPTSITVNGSIFPLARQATVEIDGVPAGPPVPVPNGTVNTVITAQGLACGQHAVTVTQTAVRGGTVITATAPLVVTHCARLTANPAVVTDGTLTHVMGTGFTPKQAVTLGWQTVAGVQLSACSPNADSAPAPTADAAGNLDMYCYARPHQVLGAAQIVAVQGTEHAAAPVVVEGGSMQPSSGDQFVFRR
jgi:hypothetical protein